MSYRITAACFILFLAIFGTATYASTITKLNTDITLNNDGTASWTIDVLYNESVLRSDYFIFGQIKDVDVTTASGTAKCSMTAEAVGTSILCINMSSDGITYHFRSLNSVRDLGKYLSFDYRFPFTQLINNATVIVRLPLGTGVIEEAKLEGTGLTPFEPDYGVQNTDGRKIYVEWALEPKLGESLNVGVIYEVISAIPPEQLIIIVILVFAVIGIGILFLHSRRHKIRHVLPVLNEGERKLMEILLREKKEVDQRAIVKELDYSKSKVSRIITDLVKRGLIDKRPKGRTNLIKLRKMYAKDDKKTTPTDTKKGEIEIE